MTDCERLLHNGSPGQRAMLAAAKDDAPSTSSQQRVLLALGVGGALATIGSTVAKAASSAAGSTSEGALASLSAPAASGIGCIAGSTGAPSLAAPAGSITIAVVMKWSAVAALTVALGVAGGLVAREVVERHGVVGAADSRQGGADNGRGTLALGVVETPSRALPAAKLGTARTEATLPLPPPYPASIRPSATSAGVASGITVRAEIALVEQARDAQRRGDPQGCLSFLETRRKGVRGGVLAPEAAILRIEALRSLGQRVQATEEAMRFRHDYPDSPLLERIRDLLSTSER